MPTEIVAFESMTSTMEFGGAILTDGAIRAIQREAA